MHRIALALILALLPADFSDRVDALVRAELARQHVAGIAVGIAYDGKVVLERGYGVRDRASGAAVDANTRFAIGSITKTFTAAAMMQLVAARRIGLDDRLERYLPAAPHARELTIRQLLTQRTGLADYTSAPGFIARVTRTDVTPDELVASIASEPLGFVPGAHFAYSNTNYLLLGMVVERVTGLPYERALAQNVLAPAQLTATSYGRPEDADDAIGYAANGPAPQWTTAVLRGAGALWSDTNDLLRFDGAFFAGRIVAPAAVAPMTTAGNAEEVPGYGFGWLVSDVGGHREIWHNGGVPGFSVRNSVFPDDKLAIVALGNSITFDAGPIVRGILALLDPQVATRPAAPARVPLDDPVATALAGEVFREFAHGSLERPRYTDEARRAFTDERVTAVAKLLEPLGAPTAVTLRERTYVGNVQSLTYRLQFAAFAIDETLGLDGNGKIAGVYFRPAFPEPPGASP